MVTNMTLILIFVTFISVSGQTFQYSRGWTNGKRDGHRRTDDPREVATSLEKILTPCQMSKLKYVLEGKISERLFVPCDYNDEDADSPKRYKAESNHEPLFEAFQ